MIEDNYDNLMEALEAISVQLNINVSWFDIIIYLNLFKKRLTEKQSDGSELWLDDVEAVAEKVKSECAIVEDSTFTHLPYIIHNCCFLNIYFKLELVTINIKVFIVFSRVMLFL